MKIQAKTVIRSLFNLYLNSSIHVALAVTAFTGVTYITLGIPANQNLLIFVFFSSVLGYNITKYGGDISRITSPHLRTIRRVTVAVFAGTLIYVFILPMKVILAALVLSVITLSYSWPVFFSKATLREITGIKIFVIASVWAFVSVGLPVLESGIPISQNVVLEFLQRILFVIVLTLPFDIRDIRFDTRQLGTIPQIIGIRKTRLLGIGLLILAVTTEWFKTPLNPVHGILFLMIALLTGILVMKSVVRQTRYFASFWVEGVPIVWLIAIYILQ